MNLRTRPSPADVDLIGWVLARADAGVVALAADFYEQFAETEPRLVPVPPSRRVHAFGIGCGPSTTTSEVVLGGPDPVLHPYDFADIGPALIDALASAFGSGWTPALQEAWMLVYNLGAAAALARGGTWVRLVELEAVA